MEALVVEVIRQDSPSALLELMYQWGRLKSTDTKREKCKWQ